MIREPDPLALELEHLAREFRPLLSCPAPDDPPPDPRNFHAALWGALLVACPAMFVLALACGAAIRWALGLPVLGGP